MAEDLSSSLHPLTPPLNEEERLSWLRLIRSRKVGVATFFRLMHEHGSATAALRALPGIAKDAGIQDYSVADIESARAEVERAKRAGAKLVCWGEIDYPQSLMNLPDAPPLFWRLGNAELLNSPMVALVGARNASSLGLRMARKLSATLSEAGFTVVSGLARGIDAAAHNMALDKATLAVMAGGVDVVYPQENKELAKQIAEKGLRISEVAMGLQPQARHFPPRNRLISGLSRAVIVIEAASQSGSLITARNALDQGREVLAVPGHPLDGRASGCNMLLRDGAVLVRNADDVIEAIGDASLEKPAAAELPDPAQKANRSLRDTNALHREILDRLGPSPVLEDQLIRDLATPASDVMPELVNLEVAGKIHRAPGGFLSISNERVD